MKKIYFILIVLCIAMFGMAYFYFSKLNTGSDYQENSLFAATANSGLVFSVYNDQRIFDILKGQDLFLQLLGKEKSEQLLLLKDKIADQPAINSLLANSDILISFVPGPGKKISYMISTQLQQDAQKQQLLEALKKGGIKVRQEKELYHINLTDSISFYLGIDKSLILISEAREPIEKSLELMPLKKSQAFVNYIRSAGKLRQNSLGNLYVDFSKIPELLSAVLPGKLSGNLAILNQLESFATLNYNFSKERIFLNGSTKVSEQDQYLHIFSEMQPARITIDQILPDNTSNYRLYSIPDYQSKFKPALDRIFSSQKKDQQISRILNEIKQTYRLDPNKIFPVYFKDQLITFQLKTGENLGAINLSNGDMVGQLLLDISVPYDNEIQQLKSPGLLFAYFGDPMRPFDTPYYTIIDNNLIVANQPSTLQDILRKYKSDNLLMNTKEYTALYNQLSKTAGISFYLNPENSTELARKTLFTPFYKHFLSQQGFRAFSSILLQLNGDKGRFQTNFMINTPEQLFNPK
ncbi:hypothetical protein [Pedobacter antarcticus]|uniref:hypothetical protein n=1 Tax=Pedobacter antarcticus TaxID=34086 RepID=UPI00115FC375|nr:hypothetical protein [Pedobacter antarcticus]